MRSSSSSWVLKLKKPSETDRWNKDVKISPSVVQLTLQARFTGCKTDPLGVSTPGEEEIPVRLTSGRVTNARHCPTRRAGYKKILAGEPRKNHRWQQESRLNLFSHGRQPIFYAIVSTPGVDLKKDSIIYIPYGGSLSYNRKNLLVEIDTERGI